jgi:hypothetical protein
MKDIRHTARPALYLNLHLDNPNFSSFMTYHRVCNWINTTGVTSGAGTAYSSRSPVFAPDIKWGSCYSIFSLKCICCRSLFDLLFYFFWTLCCLFFFDLRILIIPLVSSISSSSRAPALTPCFSGVVLLDL